MDIIVLLKQVPSTESEILINDDGRTIQEQDIKWVVNPYDEFAVEEALRIREAHGGTVTILSVGTDRGAEAIRTAIAMGADNGVLINVTELPCLDGLQVAELLAAVAKTLPHDVIIAGQRAVDDDQYLVGAAVAEWLDLPMIPMVMKQVIAGETIRCHRTLEGGTAVIEAQLPVLFTTQRGLNEPRYTSLPGIMKAKKKTLDIRDPHALGVSETPFQAGPSEVMSLHMPPARGSGIMIQGETSREKAAELVKRLREDAKII